MTKRNRFLVFGPSSKCGNDVSTHNTNRTQFNLTATDS